MFTNTKLSSDDVVTLCRKIKDNSITSIEIDNCNINYDDIQKIAEALKNNHSITYFKLDNNKIGNLGAMLIIKAISGNTTLKSISLENCDIGDDGLMAFAKIFTSGNTAITKFNLQNNSFSSQAKEDFQCQIDRNFALPTIDHIQSTLEEINVIQSAKNKDTITLTALTNSVMDQASAIDLISNFQINENINALHISSNHILDEAAKIISKELEVNKNLTVIKFDNCVISEIAIKILADALKKS